MGEKIIVILVILVIVFVIYFLCVGKKDAGGRERPAKEKKNAPKETAEPQLQAPRYEDVGTRLVSKLSMEQLDRNGRVVKSFDINEIPPEGVTVSRPGAKLGDIILSSAGGDDAMTVGTEGIVIAEDEKGMFGKIFENGHEKNKLYLFDPVVNKSREVTQFDIANNTMICIGRQWLRFVVPTVPGVPVPVGGLTADPVALRPPVAGGQVQNNVAPPAAPSGFSFESSMDDNGRFVITRK